MKPDWDKLMKEFNDHKTIVVGDVDCTAEGKPLCDSNGVQGFPTIKHGDPANLDAYEGGRDFASLNKFASALKPVCSLANPDLCDDEQKAEMDKIKAMSLEDIEAFISEQEAKSADAETTFKTELDKLQAAYKKLQEAKEATLAEVKASGVGLYKAIRAAKKASTGKEEL
jgi:hypothetical protein